MIHVSFSFDNEMAAGRIHLGGRDGNLFDALVLEAVRYWQGALLVHDIHWLSVQ